MVYSTKDLYLFAVNNGDSAVGYIGGINRYIDGHFKFLMHFFANDIFHDGCGYAIGDVTDRNYWFVQTSSVIKLPIYKGDKNEKI